jgi:putative ABC transport system permease protein
MKGWFGSSRLEEEMEEELLAHIEARASDLEASGLPRPEALRRARLEFGGYQKFKEECREAAGGTLLEALRQDLRFGLRALRKSPGFTAITVLTLAFGIGANTAIFSVVDAVLLRPLPYREPERLVSLFESKTPNDLSSRLGVAPGNFLDWRAQNRVFTQMGAASLPGFNITGTDRPERVAGAALSSGMLRLLGLRPALGREIEPSDDRIDADRVVMISHALWRARFGGDPRVIGSTLRLGTIPHTVIGVLPPGLTFPEETVDLWVPLEQTISPTDMRWRNSHYLSVYARLKPEASLAEAREEMNRIAAEAKRANPDTNSGPSACVLTVQEDLVGDIRPVLLTLFAAVGLVLLVACANVANLLLVRATGREREMAMRRALGASTSRLVRQMLTESMLLSVAGGGAGLLVAEWARRGLLALRPISLPRHLDIGTDLRVLAFTLAVSVATSLLFGLIPALRASRPDLDLALRGTSRGSTSGSGALHLRNALVAGEIALSLVLLIGAGLLIQSFVRLRDGDLGFRPDHVVTARVSIPKDKYAADAEAVGFYDRLLASVRVLPGVEAAGAVSFLPLTGQSSDNSFDVVGRPPRPPSDRNYALIRFADPEHFRSLGIPVLRGRGLDDRDRAGSPRAVVISASMAARYWPGADPLGQHVQVYMGEDPAPWEVVGVVRDVRTRIAAEPSPTMYFPYAQSPYHYMVLTVRTEVDPKAMIETLRGATRSIDPDQPLSQARTLDELLEQTLLPWRFSTTLFGWFAALALLLSVAGIYGVVSYTAGQRTREIGVRMALGARRNDVLRLVLRQGLRVSLAGVAAGLAAAFYLTRFLAAQLYGVTPRDALTFVSLAAALTALALAATYLPARRAARVEPVIALRCE